MCSVSFLPRENGFVLAMNRDERLSRSIRVAAGGA